MTKWCPSKITTRFSTSASHGYQRKIPRYKIILDTGKLKCNNNETYKTTTKQEQKKKNDKQNDNKSVNGNNNENNNGNDYSTDKKYWLIYFIFYNK